MVTEQDIIELYKKLSANGIQVWLTGGWGIDALLGRQTRFHKDLDVIMLLDDMVRLQELLSTDGYVLHNLWSENKMARDTNGKLTATAFVLKDEEGREFDAHAITLNEQGNGIPAWEEAEDFIFKKEDLDGVGSVAGFAVHCITPASQVVCHSGYELPEKQVDDLEFLHAKFGVEYPDGMGKGTQR
jgi:lincosamide nucleotidyltransferase A/C/D/E